jgi:serine/threonine protein phosphatase PrpC
MSWTLSRFDHLVLFGGASHVGNVRTSNMDAWRIDPALGAFAIADGIGSRSGGDVAARISVESSVLRMREADAQQVFDAYLASPTLEARADVFRMLEECVHYADRLVREHGAQNSLHAGLGCTLDLMLLLRSHGFIVHVGDSRAYLLRPATSIQVTNDHTLRGSLMAIGMGTPSAPPQGIEALTNAIGRQGKLKVEEVFVDLAAGDRVVLCTDGVYMELQNEAVLGELALKGSPEEGAVGLINAALSRAGRDNATAIVIDVGQKRVQRTSSDGGLAARDFSYALHCPLLSGLREKLVSHALQSAIEVKFRSGATIPRVDAADRVGYIVLEGTVLTPQGWTLGPSALLYPESLAGGGRMRELCKALQDTRAYRIRANDLAEVCSSNVELGAALYERLARNLARMLA